MSEDELRIGPIDVGLSHFDPGEVAAYMRSGYGRSPQIGTTPVLIVVDVTYEFCGRGRSAGERDDTASAKSADSDAWDVVDQLEVLIPAAREAGIQVIYSKNAARTHAVEIGGWGRKTTPQSDPADLEIVAEISPQPGDLVVEKSKPSAFFGTPLATWLIEIGADTTFITGTTTSGCVRATVVDSFSHNFRTLVVMDAVFDRSQTSHEVNLFEMQQKYAGLVSAQQLERWFAGR